jgi:nicotinamidase/pyrazinamidase
MKKLLHITDMQNDFVLKIGKLAVAGADRLVGPANEFLARARFDKIIATFDTHNTREYKNSEEGKMFPIHCKENQKGWQLAINIKQPYTIIKKNAFDVWEASGDDMLRELDGFEPEKTSTYFEEVWDDHGGHIPYGTFERHKTTPANCQVYIFGVASDFCIRYAIDGYLKRGYNVAVITDLCRGIEKQIDAVAAEFNSAKLRLTTTKEFYNGK